MNRLDPTRRSAPLLALACCLAVLAPAGAAARAPGAGGTFAPAQERATAAAGEDLLRDPPPGSQLEPGSPRDERQRPGPALPGPFAAALVAAAAAVVARAAGRPAHGGAAAAAARAPPPLRPAPI
jgi:hypothetical protein